MSTIRQITSSTTIATSDNDKTFECTGNLTLTVPAPNVLGADFELEIVNISGTTTITGFVSSSIAAGKSAKLFCNGLTFAIKLIGEGISSIPVPVAEGGTGETSLADLKTAMNLGSASETPATDYVTHALATAVSDFLVASGAGAFIKKTLAQVRTLLFGELTVPEGTPVNAVASNKILNVAGVPADNNTVTIGGIVYKWANAIAVLGAKASSLLTFTDVAVDTNTVTVDAETYTFKNALTEAKATGTLNISGVVNDGEKVIINLREYEFDTNAAISGHIPVDISAGTKTQSTGTLTLTGVVKEGETFSIGTDVYEIDANGSVTGDNIAIDVSAFMVASAGTLTLGGAIPADGETIVINGRTYTWKTTLTGAADEIKRGATVDDCIDNFVLCINDTPYGEGVVYGTGTTVNADVSASKTSGTTAVLTAKIWGTIGDTITTTETMGDGLNIFDAVTLGTTTAGVDCPAADADGQIITDYELNKTLAITATQGAGTSVDFNADAAGANDGSAGNVASTETMPNGSFGAATLTGGSDATAGEAVTALALAITNDSVLGVVTALDGAGDTVDLTAKVIGVVGNYTTTETMINGSFGAGSMSGGVDAIANEILVELTAELNIDNLVSATTGAAGEGVKYSTGTISQSNTTCTKNAADKFKAEANAYGDAGNAIPIAETMTNASWTGAALFLAGGEEAEAAYDVLIGATAEASIDNLVLAITAGAGEGTNYGIGTLVHADATAVKTDAANMTASAKVKGIAGDLIAIAETGSQTSWAGGATFLSGGVDGTVGVTNELRADASYLYHCIATNTIADANWRRISLGTAY